MKTPEEIKASNDRFMREKVELTTEEQAFFEELFPPDHAMWKGQPTQVEMVNSPFHPMDTLLAAKYKRENVGCPACNTIQPRGPINCEKCFAPLPVRTT